MVQSQILVLIVLVLLSAFFSGVKAAVISISPIKAKTLLKQKRASAEALDRIIKKQVFNYYLRVIFKYNQYSKQTMKTKCNTNHRRYFANFFF